MWADAQRDGRPAEYNWHPLRMFPNSVPCTTPQSLADDAAGVPCSDAANIGERKTWTQSEFCTWQNSVQPGKIPSRGKSPRKCIYYSVPTQETAKHRVKFGWPAVIERRRCSNEAKTRNPLKFAGVPETRQPISAVSGPKFAIL